MHADDWQEELGGLRYEDLWCLYSRLAGIIGEHLRAFLVAQKKGPDRGYPASLRSHDEWLQILRKMIYAFDKYNVPCVNLSELSEEEQARVEEGMQLFVKYFRALWI